MAPRQDDGHPKGWANARLHTPDLYRVRHVRLDRPRRVVSCEGRDYTPEELEAAFPGYVLEVKGHWPWLGANVGFRGAVIPGTERYSAKTPFEKLFGMYWAAWWLTLFACYWLEGQGFTPWNWLLPDGTSFAVHWLVAIGMVSLAAWPVHRWLAGILDQRVVERIQCYMYRRRVLDMRRDDGERHYPGA